VSGPKISGFYLILKQHNNLLTKNVYLDSTKCKDALGITTNDASRMQICPSGIDVDENYIGTYKDTI
jgi:hypothetical protein